MSRLTGEPNGDSRPDTSTGARAFDVGNVTRRTMSRRSLVFGGASAALLALLAACGGGDDEPAPATVSNTDNPDPTQTATDTSPSEDPASTGAASSEETGEWVFTDDRNVTITLPERPERIVVYSTAGAALWDFGVRPVGIFGPQLNADGTQNPQAGEIDLETVESIGEATESLDLEQLVALQPDLIVALTYDAETIWPLDVDVASQMEAIAPIVGMSASGQSADILIQRFEELAAALGADLEATQVAEDRTRFNQASEDLAAAITDKAGLTVLCVAGSDDMLYVGNPNVAPDLMYFQELGLDIAGPETEDFFEPLSWEQALKYPTDLVLNDSRGSWYSKEQLAAQPTWQEHPAQQADQIGEWLTVFPLSHRGFGKVIEELTATIEESRADVV